MCKRDLTWQYKTYMERMSKNDCVLSFTRFLTNAVLSQNIQEVFELNIINLVRKIYRHSYVTDIRLARHKYYYAGKY